MYVFLWSVSVSKFKPLLKTKSSEAKLNFFIWLCIFCQVSYAVVNTHLKTKPHFFLWFYQNVDFWWSHKKNEIYLPKKASFWLFFFKTRLVSKKTNAFFLRSTYGGNLPMYVPRSNVFGLFFLSTACQHGLVWSFWFFITWERSEVCVSTWFVYFHLLSENLLPERNSCLPKPRLFLNMVRNFTLVFFRLQQRNQ